MSTFNHMVGQYLQFENVSPEQGRFLVYMNIVIYMCGSDPVKAHWPFYHVVVTMASLRMEIFVRGIGLIAWKIVSPHSVLINVSCRASVGLCEYIEGWRSQIVKNGKTGIPIK